MNIALRIFGSLSDIHGQLKYRKLSLITKLHRSLRIACYSLRLINEEKPNRPASGCRISVIINYLLTFEVSCSENISIRAASYGACDLH